MSFQQIVELFDVPALAWSLDGAFIAQNAAVTDDILAAVHQDAVRQEIIAKLRAAPNMPLLHRFDLRGKDGPARSLSFRFKAWSSGSAVIAILAVAETPSVATSRAEQTDHKARVSEETQEDREIADRAEYGFAQLALCAPVGLYETRLDPEGNLSIPFFNDRYLELFDVSVEEILADPGAWRKKTHPDDIKRVIAERGHALQTGTVLDLKFRVNHSTKGTIWLHLRTVPYSLPNGTKILRGAANDITEQMEVENRADAVTQEARLAHDRLSRIDAYSPVSLFEWRLGSDGTVTYDYYSENFTNLLGLTGDALRLNGSAAFETMHPDDHTVVSEALERSVREASLFECTCRFRQPDDRYRWVFFRSKPQRMSDDSIVWHGIAYDVSDRIEAHSRLTAAVEEKNQTTAILDTLTNNVPAGMSQIMRSPDGQREVVFINDQMPAQFGVTREEFIADRSLSYKYIHPEDRVMLDELMFEHEKTMQPFSRRCRVLHPERGLTWLIYEASCQKRDDGSIVWNCSSVDISEQVAAERQAQDALDRLRRIAHSVTVGLYEVRQDEDGKHVLDFASKRFIELTGITAHDPHQQYEQFCNAIHPEDQKEAMWQNSDDQDAMQRQTHRFRLVRETGDTIWVSAMLTPYLDTAGRPALVGALADITKDVAREDELRHAHETTDKIRMENEHQALHDALTDLPNRRYFDQYMTKLFESARNGGENPRVTLIRIDGDRFKYTNDTFGHEAGDAVLKRIGEAMSSQCRRRDFPARVGGDEFSILLPGDHTEDERRAAALVNRIRDQLKEPMYFDGNPCNIQASFGVASVDASQESPNDLLMFADAALYRAKEQGRNRMQLFTPALRQEITDDRQIITDLHSAIDRDEIEPYFQVQINAAKMELVGVEALMRWHHPLRGVVTPDRFLHLADKLRITAELDRHMKAKAHHCLRELRAQGVEVPRVSFNASAGRLRDKEILSDVNRLIDDGFRVALELLESIMVEEEGDDFRFILDSLRECGVELEIDDFGSGRASVLGLLEVAPVALKIDRRLISHVHLQDSARKVVRAIVDIAEALDISTICEGIELPQQIDILQELGCDVMQGYHFARPLPVHGLARLLEDPPWGNTDPSQTGTRPTARNQA